MGEVNKILILLIIVIIALVVGITADYFEINRYLKYTLIVIVVVFSKKLLVKCLTFNRK